MTDQTTVRLSAVHQKDDTTPFWGLPSHEDGYLLDVSRSTFLGSRFGRFNTEYTLLTGEVAHDLQNGWKAKLLANYFEQEIDEYDLMALSPAYSDENGRPQGDLSLNVNRDAERGHNLDGSLSGDVDLFGRTHKVVFGASYLRSNLKVDERWGYDGIPVDILEPDSDIPLPGSADDGIRQNRDYRQFGVYGQVNYKLTDALTGIAGGRVNWAKMDSDITGPIIQDYRENAFFTPLLGLVYDVSQTTSLYVSYADIYEPQFQRDEAGSPLAPLTGTQYEVGLKNLFLGGQLAVNTSLFHITRENEAQRARPWPSQVYVADGETRSRGLELEVVGQLTEAWTVYGGYAFTDHEVTESKTDRLGKSASNTPEHKLNLWLSHTFQDEKLEGLRVAAGATAVSSFFDYDNALEAPGYVTVDAALSYPVHENLDLSVKASNLFDEVYYQSLGTSGTFHFYGAPRSVTFEMKAKL